MTTKTVHLNFLYQFTMQREVNAPFRWVLTDSETGVNMDFDRYRHDIIERWEDVYDITTIGD